MIIKAAKRIFNSDTICRSYSDLNFGVTFWNTVYVYVCAWFLHNTLCVLEPPFGGLGSTYTIHLRLIEKRVMDFLVLLIELFR